jgi:hypothetical protein
VRAREGEVREGRRPWLTEVVGDDPANGNAHTGKERCRSVYACERVRQMLELGFYRHEKGGEGRGEAGGQGNGH